MRAMRITEDHRLESAEVPEPVPDPGEVLIDVIAAGVNRGDLAQVAGHYPPPPGASELPGMEISGRRRDTGEEVVALIPGGGYAEVVAADEGLLLPIPVGMGVIEAGGIIEVAATALSNLVLEAGLHEGETVLIHGGTGGVGSCAIQLAKSLDARVLTTAGSAEGVRAVKELGADVALNRHTTDLPAAVAELGGVDVILDVIGGAALTDHVRMLREGGRLVIIGTLGGARGELPIMELMSRRGRVVGTTLRSRPLEVRRSIIEATRHVVWPLLESGEMTIPVHARLPLEQAGEAHAILREGGHLGKVILEVAPPRGGRHGRRRRG